MINSKEEMGQFLGLDTGGQWILPSLLLLQFAQREWTVSISGLRFLCGIELFYEFHSYNWFLLRIWMNDLNCPEVFNEEKLRLKKGTTVNKLCYTSNALFHFTIMLILIYYLSLIQDFAVLAISLFFSNRNV